MVQDNNAADTANEQLNNAAQREDCDAALVALSELAALSSDTDRVSQGHLTAAHACIISGQYEQGQQQSQKFLEQFPNHASRDYAAYLSLMAEFLAIEQAQESLTARQPGQAIQAGRSLLAKLARFRDDYAFSNYTERLIPIAESLRERIAKAEITLAEQNLTGGNTNTALMRARYVLEHYPETEAAARAKAIIDG